MTEPANDTLGGNARLNLDAEPPSANGSNSRAQESAPADPNSQDASGVQANAAFQTSAERHLTDYLRILHKRRWTGIASFLPVFGVIAAYTFTATPIYEAKAQLLIESQQQNIVQFQQVLEENRAAIDYYQTQYRILQSRTLARRTLDAEKLWTHPAFAPVADDGQSQNVLATLSKTTATPVRDDAPATQRDRLETQIQSVAIDRLLANLTISPVRNSRLVDVRYRSIDPNLASRVANALSKQYIEQDLEFRFLATKEATEFLAARMAEQRQALETSERALQKYREQTGAMALEDRQNIVVQRLADLNAAVTRARTERIEKEAVYNQIRAVQTDRAAVDTLPAILSNGFIQQLKSQSSDLQRQQAQMADKLGPRHPEMVKVQTAIDSIEARIAAEIQKVVEAQRNAYQAALSNERALQASLDQQRAEAQDLNRAAIQYGVLERDTATNRQMFDGLLQRSKETDISGDLKTSSIRIVDAAETPQTPVSPNRRSNVLFGLIAGLLVGVAMVFFFEYLDARIKSPDEIKAGLGLAFLGLVPSIDTRALSGPPLVHNEVPHQFGDAFRSIRTNVLFSSVDAGSRSILVTSTAPGEGKTVVSSNLAISLATAGQRVILIDADMRRPKVHEYFRTNQEAGLSNVMVGESRASEAVRKTSVANLWILPSGKTPPNPAELLGSRRFRDFLASLNHHFDWIIVDSPPVMAVPDACVAAHYVTGVLFVVGAEMTNRAEARSALEKLDAARAKYIGAVLNRVDVSRNAYYYSRYYRKKYSEYYTTTGVA